MEESHDASCAGCAAVAVSFQVVLIVGEADVVVPQNLAAAVTYDCVACVAYALASQLVITLDEPLSAAARAELEALWRELAAYGATIRDRPLDEIEAVLSSYRDRIRDIVVGDAEQLEGTLAPTPTPTPAAPAPAPAPSGEPTSPAIEQGEEATPPAAPEPSPSETTAPSGSESPAPSETGATPEPSGG